MLGLSLIHNIHSGKLRAEQTAEYIVKNLNPPSLLQINDNINPNNTLQPLIEQMQAWNKDTLIVGHLPYLAKLSFYLATNNDSSVKIAFQPGTMCCLERSDDNQWQINWVVRPELLTP